MNPYLTAKERKEISEVVPLYLRFDDCIERGEADCLRQVFNEWNKIDDEIDSSMEGPLARGFNESNKLFREIQKKIFTSISADGKVDLQQVKEDFKTLYQDLFS